MSERHRVVDGKVYVYRRERSPYWQCAVYLDGRNHRRSTGHDNLALAMEFARDWYQDQLAEARMIRKGVLPARAEPPAPSPIRRPYLSLRIVVLRMQMHPNLDPVVHFQ